MSSALADSKLEAQQRRPWGIGIDRRPEQAIVERLGHDKDSGFVAARLAQDERHDRRIALAPDRERHRRIRTIRKEQPLAGLEPDASLVSSAGCELDDRRSERQRLSLDVRRASTGED